MSIIVFFVIFMINFHSVKNKEIVEAKTHKNNSRAI